LGPDCQSNLFGSFDELGLDDDRSVGASVNVEDRVGVRVFAARRTVDIELIAGVWSFGRGFRFVVAVALSLVPGE
jgi:hypothetical protein